MICGKRNEEMFFHALDEDGYLWFWGQDVHGNGGVGANVTLLKVQDTTTFQEE